MNGDDIAPEYDASKARPARHFERAAERALQNERIKENVTTLAEARRKTMAQYRASVGAYRRSGRVVVQIDADLAGEFSDQKSVNAALRKFVQLRKTGIR